MSSSFKRATFLICYVSRSLSHLFICVTYNSGLHNPEPWNNGRTLSLFGRVTMTTRQRDKSCHGRALLSLYVGCPGALLHDTLRYLTRHLPGGWGWLHHPVVWRVLLRRQGLMSFPLDSLRPLLMGVSRLWMMLTIQIISIIGNLSYKNNIYLKFVKIYIMYCNYLEIIII